MENIVSKIIEIDQQANQKLADSENRKREILANAKADASRCRAELETAAERRIREVRAFHQSEYDRKAALLAEQQRQAIAALDAAYAQKHTEIEDAIFHEIVGE